MSGARLDPEFEPRLVEAAVLAAIRGHARERELHGERDAVYDILEPELRESAFEALHARWFERLALERPFRDALAQQPEIAAGCGRCLVTQARGRRDEAADLLGPPRVTRSAPAPPTSPDVRPTLLVRVMPETVAAPERVWPLLRRELLHVADMLDPGFGYETTLPPGAAGSARERVIRENYRVLWNVWVDGRLVRWGVLPAAARAARLAEFARAFPHLADGAETAFDRFFGAHRLTHAALVALATDGPDGAPLPRCRLCDLPTRDFEPAPTTLPDDIVVAIRRDAPLWQPADGLCSRCAELYASRVTM